MEIENQAFFIVSSGYIISDGRRLRNLWQMLICRMLHYDHWIVINNYKTDKMFSLKCTKCGFYRLSIVDKDCENFS